MAAGSGSTMARALLANYPSAKNQDQAVKTRIKANMTNSPVPLNLDAFLASVERRAYRMALLATHEPAEALDIVQDAMLKLVEKYRRRSHQEWPALFQRILQNRILDWHRRKTTTQRWRVFLRPSNDDDEAEDALEQFADPREHNPAELLARADDMDIVLKVVGALPIRQQQAFLLRAWEGLDTAATAAAMTCSEGAVKTHYFRALNTLRSALQPEAP